MDLVNLSNTEIAPRAAIRMRFMQFSTFLFCSFVIPRWFLCVSCDYLLL